MRPLGPERGLADRLSRDPIALLYIHLRVVAPGPPTAGPTTRNIKVG